MMYFLAPGVEYDNYTQEFVVDGIRVSRAVFKWFADAANKGKTFRYIDKNGNGNITIEDITPSIKLLEEKAFHYDSVSK
jgi:hypothetical protein